MSARISRRSLLVGGGAGVGLIVAWALWPRAYRPNLAAGPGEHMLDAFVKIGEDGHVAVAVPQAEMGQGVWTALPQILADELGADWRTVSVEPAPTGPLYANELLFAKLAEARAPASLAGAADRLAGEIAEREALMVTAGSTSIRAFEARFRAAGATARALLCMAAAERWKIDWRACDTEEGFVVRGEDRLRFAELAARAAAMTPPDEPPLRDLGQGGLIGQSVPRLDLPTKVDGSLRFASDVRLPDMLFAAVRNAPAGHPLPPRDMAAARKIGGMRDVVEAPGWVATVASNWWAANRALEALCPRAPLAGAPDDASVERALKAALDGPGGRFASAGDLERAFRDQQIFVSEYRAPFAPHANPEPPAATVRMAGDRLEVWAPTQAPGALRDRVAAACGLSPHEVTLYPLPAAGGFGRTLEADAAVQAALIARRVGRPVQLMWSREEELAAGPHRPPALARMSARMLAGGEVIGWQAQIAAPSTFAQVWRRLGLPFGGSPGSPSAQAVAGAAPPYAFPALAVDHHPAEIGVPTASWRSDAHSYTCFFTEAFVDELAHRAGVDPFTFRLRLLGGVPRLAHCLSAVTGAGGWDGGGAGSGQGLAVHSAFGSHIALLAEARMEAGRPRVDRIVAAVDCGRVIHPEIVRQQIEGGILWGLAAALGDATGYSGGRAAAPDLATLGLPRLAAAPEIEIHLMTGGLPPGGVGELGVPPVAPAVANALATIAGGRFRSLPLGRA